MTSGGEPEKPKRAPRRTTARKKKDADS
jgi:hypothetical protein